MPCRAALTPKSQAKRKYDDACGSVEASRVKQGHAKDDRHVHRANKSMDSHSLDMAVAKNSYLIALDVASAEKNRFFQADLPALHNDFQALWTVTTKKSQNLLRKVNLFARLHYDQQVHHADNVLASVDAISPEQDQAVFVDHNRRPFHEPPDFTFEPCAIWHDTPDFLITLPEPKILLQNRLAVARARLPDLETAIDAKRKEVTSSEKLRDKYAEKEELGDVDEIVEGGFDAERQSILLEMQLTSAVKETEVLEEVLGSAFHFRSPASAYADLAVPLPEDQGSQQPHSFKNASFISPTVWCAKVVLGEGKH